MFLVLNFIVNHILCIFMYIKNEQKENQAKNNLKGAFSKVITNKMQRKSSV